MRVTNRMNAELITRELFRNHQALLDAQVKVSTGKKINKPSDDPVGMGKILNYRKLLASVDQYKRNISDGKAQIEITETALDQIDTFLKQAEYIAQEHGANDRDDRPQAIVQLKNIFDQILDIANTTSVDGYLLAGYETDSAPYTRNADGISNNADDWIVTYNGDDGDIRVPVNNNIDVKVNVTGQDVFNSGTDIFAALHDLIINMETYNQADVRAQVSNLRDGIDQVQAAAAEGSANYGRLETAENHLLQFESNIQDMLGETEDVDMAQAIVQLQLQETAYTTSLEVAARIIQKSLVDFV
jgi:flagellar hook-associated protein 3 FlgL